MWRTHATARRLSSNLLYSNRCFPSLLTSKRLLCKAPPTSTIVDEITAASTAEASPAVVGSLTKARDISDALRRYGTCYWELSKAKLSMLVVATSGAGYVLGSGNIMDFGGLCCTCAGTMMVAASASTLNQVFEVQNDAKMKRTAKRPLPSGRISVPHAAIWASTVGIAGTSLLAWQTNYLTASLAASNLCLYAFVYTPLKQIHPINTWVGAIVGAIPPLLGWTAACGEISMNAMILPAALYFWQLPHFMALAYLCRDDYLSGGFRMLSFADPSGRRTALVSFRNCLYLLPLGFLAYNWGMTSEWFAVESSLLTLCIATAALSFVNNRTTKNARRMFHSSLLYLPVFMSGMLLHRLPNGQEQTMLNAMINSNNKEELLVSDVEARDLNDENNTIQSRKTRISAHAQVRAPVAFASVAPFPFLPAPLYVSLDTLDA